MQPFLAMIIPVGNGGGSGSPPGIWGPTDPRPGYWVPGAPGAPGYQPPASGSPPGIWGPTDPRPGYWVPGAPGSPGWPGGGGGLGMWGGANEPFPTPPIVIIPPSEPGKPPLVIWGPNDPRPTPPIELPGGGNPPPGGQPVRIVDWHTAWTEETGWVVVGVPTNPHPTPSKK